MCLHLPPPQEFSLDLYDDRAFISDGLDFAVDVVDGGDDLREPGVSSIETSAVKFTKEGGISITAFVAKSLRDPRAPTFFLTFAKELQRLLPVSDTTGKKVKEKALLLLLLPTATLKIPLKICGWNLRFCFRSRVSNSGVGPDILTVQ
ncbi:ethylene receptor 1 [Striga asiatica]|uniref:Ethylene receptor 1 n=1 Tax=Striga asiatica TaxID=4170 RepID=A0A5A7P230_STRAF|nr:ethylene receptor 1 [Striga asiatica]